jgi:hypothetical protein
VDAKSIFIKYLFNSSLCRMFDEEVFYQIQKQLGGGDSDIFDTLQSALVIVLEEEFAVFEKTPPYRNTHGVQKNRRRRDFSQLVSLDWDYSGLDQWTFPGTEPKTSSSSEGSPSETNLRDKRRNSIMGHIRNSSSDTSEGVPDIYLSSGSPDASSLESPRWSPRGRSFEISRDQHSERREKDTSSTRINNGVLKPGFQKRKSISLVKSLARTVEESLKKEY